MNKKILTLVLLLTSCGGSSSTPSSTRPQEERVNSPTRSKEEKGNSPTSSPTRPKKEKDSSPTPSSTKSKEEKGNSPKPSSTRSKEEMVGSIENRFKNIINIRKKSLIDMINSKEKVTTSFIKKINNNMVKTFESEIEKDKNEGLLDDDQSNLYKFAYDGFVDENFLSEIEAKLYNELNTPIAIEHVKKQSELLIEIMSLKSMEDIGGRFEILTSYAMKLVSENKISDELTLEIKKTIIQIVSANKEMSPERIDAMKIVIENSSLIKIEDLLKSEGILK